MAIGGFGGALLAGLAGLGQGLEQAQKDRERQQLMQLRQRQLINELRSDEASKALFGGLLGGMGDITGPSALSSPMMTGGQPPMPGMGSVPNAGRSYSPTPSGSGMSSGLSNPGSLAMAESPDVQEAVAKQLATTSGIQHWADWNPKLNAALRQAGLPTSGPLNEIQWDHAKPLILQYESAGGQNIPNYRFDRTHTAGGPFQITNSTWNSIGGPSIAARMRGGSGSSRPEIPRAPEGDTITVPPPSSSAGFAPGSSEEAYTLRKMRPEDRSAEARRGVLDRSNAYADALAGGFRGTRQDFEASGGAATPQPAADAGGGDAPAAAAPSDQGGGMRSSLAAPSGQGAAGDLGRGDLTLPPLQAAIRSAPPPVQQEVQRTVVQAATSIPQAAFGRMSLNALAQQIQKANPGIDPIVGMMALEKAQKLLAPSEQQRWQEFKLQHDDAIHLADRAFQRETALLAEDRQIRAEDRRQNFQIAQQQRGFEHSDAQAANKGWDFITQPDGSIVRANKGTGQIEPVEGLAAGSTKMGARGTQINQDAVDFAAKEIAEYKMPMPPGGRSTPFNQAVLAKVKQINPEYDQAKYNARNRGLIAFTSGRQSDSVRSFSVAIDHLETMEQAAEALANGDTRALNQIKNEVQRQFGYAGPVDFDFAKSIVGAEVSKAIVGGVGALTDREELRQSFDKANSPEQLRAVAARAKQLIAGQLGGYRRQAESTGMATADFDKALSEPARKQLFGLTSGAPSTDGGGGQSSAQTMPLPPELKDVPDGKTVRSPEGELWIKRGNQLIKAPAGAVEVK